MNLKDLKKDCAQKQKKGIHFYHCISSNMDYGFNRTINRFTYINKKSIDILLHCTIITYSFFNF